MDTYRSLNDAPQLDASALTVGTFDGLHLGHQAVISHLVDTARQRRVPSVVVTFEPHPRQILGGQGSGPLPGLLLDLPAKLALLEGMAVDVALVLEFDLPFSRISAEKFLETYLVEHFHPVSIVVGYDNRFGHNREGGAEFLRQHRDRFDYSVVELTAVNSRSADPLSSSRIRTLLNAGMCAEAEAILGRPYGMTTMVVKGDSRGRELGFPTANLEPVEATQLMPAQGVYIVALEGEDWTSFGMANIGTRPTFGSGELRLEAHLFEPPEGGLYGQQVRIRFHSRLRDEQKFEDAQALRDQLQTDRKESLQWVKQYREGNPIHATVE